MTLRNMGTLPLNHQSLVVRASRLPAVNCHEQQLNTSLLSFPGPLANVTGI